ncbi:metal-sensing transcriptional repressor [Rhodanobacter sp. UC4436_H3]
MSHTSRNAHTTHPDILKRLRRAIGQLNSIVVMIEEERACTEVAMQLKAVEKAIVQAKKTFIHDHIDHCLDEGIATTSRAVLEEFKEMSKYL